MAPPPREANGQDQQKRPAPRLGGDSPAPERINVKDSTPEHLRDLRRVARAAYWESHKNMLDVLRMVCPSDAQYDAARSAALDIINQGEQVLMASVLAVASTLTGDGKRNG